MLKVILQAQVQHNGKAEDLELNGSIGNLSSLSALSSYGFGFEGRPERGKLENYPRWCESAAGLLARCLNASRLALGPTEPSTEDPRWASVLRLNVQLGLVPGGWGQFKLLNGLSAQKTEQGLFECSLTEEATGQVTLSSVSVEASYKDAWHLAEQLLRELVWQTKVLPKPKALEVPLVKHGNLVVVRLEDIPQPARAAFAKRMAHSTRPYIPELGEVYYVWDWNRFLGV